jgi:hypothetical protein
MVLLLNQAADAFTNTAGTAFNNRLRTFAAGAGVGSTIADPFVPAKAVGHIRDTFGSLSQGAVNQLADNSPIKAALQDTFGWIANHAGADSAVGKVVNGGVGNISTVATGTRNLITAPSDTLHTWGRSMGDFYVSNFPHTYKLANGEFVRLPAGVRPVVDTVTNSGAGEVTSQVAKQVADTAQGGDATNVFTKAFQNADFSGVTKVGNELLDATSQLTNTIKDSLLTGLKAGQPAADAVANNTITETAGRHLIDAKYQIHPLKDLGNAVDNFTAHYGPVVQDWLNHPLPHLKSSAEVAGSALQHLWQQIPINNPPVDLHALSHPLNTLAQLPVVEHITPHAANIGHTITSTFG